ncbi:hypothetical protein ACIPY3_05190 [Paenarthrobacter sp. NPDC089714]|uniref:hypothetical protein n=1 Tax=Paenarthrobacter sp. NPDC089714 TaxID=3364377 RepID=UPI0038268B3B
MKQRLEAYGRAVHALDADISLFPSSIEVTHRVKDDEITTTVTQHWSGDADLNARRERLATDIKAIHDDYLNAQNTCAQALAVISGGPVYAATAPTGPDPKFGNWVDALLWDAGTYAGIDRPQDEQPWGNQTIPYRPNGGLGLLQGIGAAFIETVDGIWSLSGTLNPIKRDLAWGGINTTIGAAGTLAGASIPWRDEETKEREEPKVKEARDLFTSIGPAFIHLEENETTAAWAAGASVFNVSSLFLGAGAGAGIKASKIVSSAGMAAGRLSLATIDSAKYAAFAAKLAASSHLLLKTADFLEKPGSLALKVSDLLMPNTTAKVQDALTRARVGTWNLVTNARAGATEAVSAAKDATAKGLSVLAEGLRAADASLPKAVFPTPGGALTRTGRTHHASNWLETRASAIRGNNPPPFVPPLRTSARHPAVPSVLPDHFVVPDRIENTIILKHGDGLFPVSRRENFAARTNLKPFTEYVIEHRSLMKNSQGIVNKPTLEKFYTDATGTVRVVDTYGGVRGAWSLELNKPLPNVTYNVVVEVDGGLQNTFTLVMDQNAELASAKGHIVSTLVGDSNRNGYQQRKAGRLGGPGYDGGHAAPSGLGFIGEGAGIFPQHMWQNRGVGIPNDIQNFHEVEMEVINTVKRKLTAEEAVDLTWEMELVPGTEPGVPAATKLTYYFDADLKIIRQFNNTTSSKQVLN